jgi:hypothetical protein
MYSDTKGNNMKTITMDYELYKKELEAARLLGAQTVEQEMEKILVQFYDSDLETVRNRYQSYEYHSAQAIIRNQLMYGEK